MPRENAAASFGKGDSVIAAYDLRVDDLNRTGGTLGRSNEITADVLGASVRYGSVTTERSTRITKPSPPAWRPQRLHGRPNGDGMAPPSAQGEHS